MKPVLVCVLFCFLNVVLVLGNGRDSEKEKLLWEGLIGQYPPGAEIPELKSNVLLDGSAEDKFFIKFTDASGGETRAAILRPDGTTDYKVSGQGFANSKLEFSGYRIRIAVNVLNWMPPASAEIKIFGVPVSGKQQNQAQLQGSAVGVSRPGGDSVDLAAAKHVVEQWYAKKNKTSASLEEKRLVIRSLQKIAEAGTGDAEPRTAVLPLADSWPWVVDDSGPACTYEGAWKIAVSGTSVGNSSHYTSPGEEIRKVRWSANLAAGRYRIEVYVGDDPAHDHTNAAPYTVLTVSGPKKILVDQGKEENLCKWISLGEFDLASGPQERVILTNECRGNVVADAVRFTPVK